MINTILKTTGFNKTAIKARHAKAAVALVALAALSGCAGNGVLATKTDEQIVWERAQARLDALINKNLKEAYKYASPGLRAVESVNEYHARVAGAALWTKAKVQNVDCVADACQVNYWLSYRLLRFGMTEMSQGMQEKWIKVDNQWWIYHKL